MKLEFNTLHDIEEQIGDLLYGWDILTSETIHNIAVKTLEFIENDFQLDPVFTESILSDAKEKYGPEEKDAYADEYYYNVDREWFYIILPHIIHAWPIADWNAAYDMARYLDETETKGTNNWLSDILYLECL